MTLETQALATYDFRREATAISGKMSFSRQSEGSYYGSDRYLHFTQQGQNQLTNSENFANPSWNKVAITAGPNSDTKCPDGTFAANIIAETDASGEHRMTKLASVEKGTLVTMSIYLKAGTAKKIMFCFMESATYTGGNPGIRFDLSTGTLLSKSSNAIAYEALNCGDGWWRLKLTAQPDLGTKSGMHLYLLTDGNTISHKGSSDKYLYAWGAQFEQGSTASAYTATSVTAYHGLRYNYDLAQNPAKLAGALIEPEATNLVPYSQLQTNAAWRKQSAFVAATDILSPDGTENAFKLREDSSTAQHYIMPYPTIPCTNGKMYTFSAFLKAAERKWAYFNLNGLSVHFDLENGVLGNYNPIFKNIVIEDAGNGWYRCAAAFELATTSTSAKIGPEISNGQASYSGNGSAGIYIWGTQLELGETATSYIRTSSGPAVRNEDSVTLSKPSGSASVFLQRTNGGIWVDDVVDNYQIHAENTPVQYVGFYNAGLTTDEKDQIVRDQFPEEYKTVGPNNTLIPMFGNTYVVQRPNKDTCLTQAVNKYSPVFNFSLDAGDMWPGDANNPKKKERSEVYMKNADLPFDTDVWLAYSMKIEIGDTLNLTPSEHCYLGQFHASEEAGEATSPPVLGYRFEGSNVLKVFTSSTTERIQKTAPATILRGTAIVERGIWHRIVMRIRFSSTKGMLQWWVNGQQITNVAGVGIGYNDPTGPYWKFGIYRSAIPQSFSVKYANMEHVVGGSLADRINNPLPIV